MIAVFTLLKNELQTNAGLVAMVGNDCYAVVAPQAEDIGKLFVVYTLSEDEPLTKDGGQSYTLTIHCSASDIDILLQLMQVVKDATELLSINADYLGSTPIDQSQDQHYTIDLNYNITL